MDNVKTYCGESKTFIGKLDDGFMGIRKYRCSCDIKPTLLLTGCGCPGIWGTAKSLGDYRLIGCDVRKDTVGKHFCEKTYQVPQPSNHKYLAEIKKIIKQEKVDLVIPLTTYELEELSKLKTPVLSGNLAMNDKARLFEVLSNAYYVVPFFQTLTGSVIKPNIGSGEDNVHVTTGNGIVMEYLPGKEYTVDCLAKNGKMVICVPRTRDVIRDGITFEGVTIKHDIIMGYCQDIIEIFHTDGLVGFQFKEDAYGNPKLIDCNPRIQGSMYHSTLVGVNIIEGAVKQKLTGESGLSQRDVKWEVKMKRFWGMLKG